MPDITMCISYACPASKDCYRHRLSGTKPTERTQSYAIYQPAAGYECSGFWDTRDHPDKSEVIQ